MERQAVNPSDTSVRYLFLTRDQWRDRDAVVSEMRRRGARPEEIKARLGPEPPRIEYKLLPAPLPKLEAIEQWSDEWARSAAAAFQEYQKRQSATSRQAYISFFGECPKEPTCHRVYGADSLAKWAALRLLGKPWKEIVDGRDLTSADDLEKAMEGARKAVAEFLKWTRLDDASIARNKAADACRILREIGTWEEQGNELTAEDQAERAKARAILAELSGARKRPKKRKRRAGRPRIRVNRNRIVQLKDSGASWNTIASALGIAATTARRAYRLAKTD